MDGPKDACEAVELQQLDQPTAAADEATDPEGSPEFEPTAEASPQPEAERAQDVGRDLDGAALYDAEQTQAPSTSGGFSASMPPVMRTES